jgi:uncharacterized membrane protein
VLSYPVLNNKNVLFLLGGLIFSVYFGWFYAFYLICLFFLTGILMGFKKENLMAGIFLLLGFIILSAKIFDFIGTSLSENLQGFGDN